MTSDEQIKDIFEKVAERYDYTTVSVRIAHFKHFKIRWRRVPRTGMIQFAVSHYMRYAPDWFVEESANRMIADMDHEYAPEPSARYVQWLDENRYRWSR